jgi:hypothetical protein
MKKTTLRLLAALLAVVSATVVGAAHEGHPQRGEASPIHRELGSYVETKVLPVLQKQRQKLEVQLSAADRADLATYRTRLQDNRARSRALAERLFSSTIPQDRRPGLSEEQLQQFRALRTENWEITQHVRQMAQKYADAIEQLLQEVQPQREQWTNDVQAIVAKNAPSVRPEHQARFIGHRTNGLGVLHHLFRPSAFLLREAQPLAVNAAEAAPMSTGIYPNPIMPSSQLDYQMKAAGPVTVDLLDKNGNKLRTLLTEPNAEKGSHTQPLNLSDLPAGTYYYKVTTKEDSQTKRFVKE